MISTHLVGKDSEGELSWVENAQELSDNVSVGLEYDISLKADIRTLFLWRDVNCKILVPLQKDRGSDGRRKDEKRGRGKRSNSRRKSRRGRYGYLDKHLITYKETQCAATSIIPFNE